MDSCTIKTTGKNMYFVLEPGFQLTLQGFDGKDKGKLGITVLNETKKTGNVETRIVEENESANGRNIEISRTILHFVFRQVVFLFRRRSGYLQGRQDCKS